MIDTLRLRDGTAPESTRRRGALGDVPVSLQEKIEILVLLSTDRDVEVSRQALHTLRHWNMQELDQVLSDPSTSSAVIDFAFDRTLEEQEDLRKGVGSSSAASEALPPTTKSKDSSSVSLVPEHSEPVMSPKSVGQPGPVTAEKDAGRDTLPQRVARMTVAEKVKLALLVNQEERLVLIRDPDRVVARSVLPSPKVSDSEVQSFAAMRDVKEEVLRIIPQNRNFMKSPAVVRALIFNPRSPIDVSLPLIKLLKDPTSSC